MNESRGDSVATSKLLDFRSKGGRRYYCYEGSRLAEKPGGFVFGLEGL
jgi:hypothetical protein